MTSVPASASQKLKTGSTDAAQRPGRISAKYLETRVSLMKETTKRTVFRTLLFLHFIGLGLSVGTRAADFLLDMETRNAGLQTLALGRDLIATAGQRLTLPGFILMVVTGVSMAILLYGTRPPIWVWIKLTVATAIAATAIPIVAPALATARKWAHWSVDHGQLAPQFQEYLTKGNIFGGLVLALFLINIAIAVWKPLSSERKGQVG